MTKALLEGVLEHARISGATHVEEVSIELGELCDFEDDMLVRYFAWLAEGTCAEGAVLSIKRLPAKVACERCGEVFELRRGEFAGYTCPACGCDRAHLISGREMMLMGILVS